MGKISKAMKIIPEAGRKLSKLADEASDTSRQATKALKRTDTGPGPVKPLDVGTYGDLKKREKVGDNLEHDHIPSSAALKKAKEKELGRKLTPQEAREIHERGSAIEVPKEVHAQGDTFRGRNTPDQIDADASDLGAAAKRDYTTTRKNLIDHGYSPEEVDAALDRMREANRKKGI
jgi:filamentous hemagglutinin